MLSYDRKARRVQQILEIILFVAIFLSIFSVVFRQSKRNEIIAKIGQCNSIGHDTSKAISSFTQRIYEYFFRPRFKGDFVFDVSSFYEVNFRRCYLLDFDTYTCISFQTMTILSLGTSGFTQYELRSALELPCQESISEKEINKINSTFVYQDPDEVVIIKDHFLKILKTKPYDIFRTTRKFHENINKDDDSK